MQNPTDLTPGAGNDRRQDLKIWRDPELVFVRIEETEATAPPGSDFNSVGS